MVKAALLFLIFIFALGIFGRLRLPKSDLAQRMRRRGKCPDCGRYRIGAGPCACRGGKDG